jgi:hypothetical protein
VEGMVEVLLKIFLDIVVQLQELDVIKLVAVSTGMFLRDFYYT